MSKKIKGEMKLKDHSVTFKDRLQTSLSTLKKSGKETNFIYTLKSQANRKICQTNSNLKTQNLTHNQLLT